MYADDDVVVDVRNRASRISDRCPRETRRGNESGEEERKNTAARRTREFQLLSISGKVAYACGRISDDPRSRDIRQPLFCLAAADDDDDDGTRGSGDHLRVAPNVATARSTYKNTRERDAREIGLKGAGENLADIVVTKIRRTCATMSARVAR